MKLNVAANVSETLDLKGYNFCTDNILKCPFYFPAK